MTPWLHVIIIKFEIHGKIDNIYSNKSVKIFREYSYFN